MHGIMRMLSLAVLYGGGIAMSAIPVVAQQVDTEAAQQENAPRPEISITKTIEDDEELVLATVTLHGEPLEGVQVAFFVKRTFGLLSLGSEVTLDDGTSAVVFPARLPGGPEGELHVVAEIKDPPEYESVRAEATLGGGVPAVTESEPFPRALWAPKAPLALVLTIALLIGGVWCTYGYVFGQLLKIRKGGLS